ncbi:MULTISPECIES: lipopolysaccharide biosynthesis protein [Aeromonas]|uniref:lipopolysaccharide biosynthesis protein n=1 Tax=Aeromonas TaxID=642 RepID=UPI000B1BB6E9|nr:MULTISPECIES: polysaccharide biosynthesis protein [Aeromonas]QXB29558.1 hypothetical protein I6L35_20205 [Aeromonas sp. FDAARGOS 1405]
MIKSNSFIASSFSTAAKTISNFGLFFLIGHFYEPSVFSQYIYISVIAAFLAAVVDMGYSTKIVVDFTEKKQSRALHESYLVRGFASLSIIFLFLIFSFFYDFNMLFLLIFINSVLTCWLESFSFSLRFESKYWLEFFFTTLVHFFPFLISACLLVLNVQLDTLFLFSSVVKFCVFVFLYLKLKRDNVTWENIKGELFQCRRFFVDSLSMNIQPFFQVFIAKLFLASSEFIIFGYAQKIIQAFTTLFSAINNVFYPSLASNWALKEVVRNKIKNFFLVVNSLPCCALLFSLFYYLSPLDFSGFLNGKYIDLLGVLSICSFVVMIRFNNAVLGCLLILSGMQKLRAKVNIISFLIEITSVLLICQIYPFKNALLGVIVFSNLFILTSYLWAIYNDENLSSIVFNWKENKVK